MIEGEDMRGLEASGAEPDWTRGGWRSLASDSARRRGEKYHQEVCLSEKYHQECRKDKDIHDHIQLNTDFRYRVVRLIDDPEKKLSCKFKVQIFSSETGEWTESIVTTPSPVHNNFIDTQIYFPWNGVLYWLAHDCDFLIGVDPFMITDRNSTSVPSTSSYGTPDDGIGQYRCRFIEFDQHAWDDTCVLQCVGVNRGHLQMLGHDLETLVLYVVELNEEEVSTAAGKFCLDQRVKNYALDWEMVPDDDAMYLVLPLGFDPSDDGTVYLHIGEGYSIGEIFRYNIHTGEWLKIVEKSLLERFKFYPLVLPWVPTPVPRLPEHARLVKSPNSNLATCKGLLCSSIV
ncbi:hypothetical protein ACLB2K_021970 [Fragaria x ananassa]